MTTLSVPVDASLEARLDALVEDGVGPTRAAVMRTALQRLSEDHAVKLVLDAMREPSLSGNIRTLMKKIA